MKQARGEATDGEMADSLPKKLLTGFLLYSKLNKEYYWDMEGLWDKTGLS